MPTMATPTVTVRPEYLLYNNNTNLQVLQLIARYLLGQVPICCINRRNGILPQYGSATLLADCGSAA